MSTPFPNRLRESVALGIRYLGQRQLPSGEFSTFHTSGDGVWAYHSSPFATALIVHSLASMHDVRLEPLLVRARDYLIGQRAEPGVWRYLPNLDPDVDTTSCCAAALASRGVAGATRGELADVNSLLQNRAPNGLFHTWIRQHHERNDVDSAVNANVLFLLGNMEETRAAADYLVRVVDAGQEKGSYWYYEHDVTLHYFISRAWRAGVTHLGATRQTILRAMLRDRNEGALEEALSLCTLRNFRCEEREVVIARASQLIERQEANGSWPNAPFMRNAGPTLAARRRMSYSGSAELTTAFALEALANLG